MEVAVMMHNATSSPHYDATYSLFKHLNPQIKSIVERDTARQEAAEHNADAMFEMLGGIELSDDDTDK
jgi:hypothetical protein